MIPARRPDRPVCRSCLVVVCPRWTSDVASAASDLKAGSSCSITWFCESATWAKVALFGGSWALFVFRNAVYPKDPYREAVFGGFMVCGIVRFQKTSEFSTFITPRRSLHRRVFVKSHSVKRKIRKIAPASSPPAVICDSTIHRSARPRGRPPPLACPRSTGRAKSFRAARHRLCRSSRP